MYSLIRRILFLFDAELIHEFSVKAIKLLCLLPFSKQILRYFFLVNTNVLERNLFGLKFKNPVGLAAGFDKNAECYNEFSNFGFGFIEIGTVTPLPQPGNPKKRIFRLIEDKSLINRLGFNNKGLDEISKNLKKERDVLIGANIGKNFFTDNKDGHKDYLKCLQGLHDLVDYFAINISSPNTKNLRQFQNKELLKPLLENLINYNNNQTSRKPMLLKISPDLERNELDDIISLISELKIDGVIATNTSISRDNVKSKFKNETGGLSGALLKEKSNDIIKYLRKNLDNNFPIIGVGGIMNAEDAIEKFKCGADLVQLYTGFIYKGPILIKKINKLLLKSY
ncbi:MAG: quinone-dependent dihydroorotate dehydrogenase [Cryomorphaceae bacterium]|jgi:dihydroorotate dehydrogenase|nr:quinone-dependent dihydroorotate dehydrogenase [Cryomorphaceae bacterium]MDG1889644.1 quinone-dependent dihydroorotate dehydrogenase [Flavobacteriaceae bacterium]MBT3503398.1 quinone-dependent dihydroorotate dehydrogenase [Cryomorphaceae bacterium]MBT3688636.1 quinone-dependent dihydroorotate dehydrogenase [Cryomorphaceae bacterium]MBT4222243.1 quinone-dependent dihydroorotate dehydrogenase [Cryomorphaceae bacterium]